MKSIENNERREFLVKECKSFIMGIHDELIKFILERHPEYKRVMDDYERGRTEYKNPKNNTWLVIIIPDNHLPKTLTIWIHNVDSKNLSVAWDFNRTELNELYENKLKKVL